MHVIQPKKLAIKMGGTIVNFGTLTPLHPNGDAQSYNLTLHIRYKFHLSQQARLDEITTSQ